MSRKESDKATKTQLHPFYWWSHFYWICSFQKYALVWENLWDAVTQDSKNSVSTVKKILTDPKALYIINWTDEYSFTILYRAVERGNQKVINLLIEKKADANIRNIAGYTPLHFAALNHMTEIFHILVKPGGADQKITNNTGWTPQELLQHSNPAELKYISRKDFKCGERLNKELSHYSNVYKGKYNNQDVAIKKLRIDDQKDINKFKCRFKIEAEIMAKSRSPHIVEIYAVCFEGQNCFIIMELLKESVFHLLSDKKRTKALAWKEVGQFALDIIEGLALLHEKNILHRDLKSLNILVDDKNRAKVSDFGLSKEESMPSMISSGNKIKGTPHWLATELFQNPKSVSKAADIYAFAIVLWELLIFPHKVPFAEVSRYSIGQVKLQREQKKPPQPQLELPSSCPSNLADLINRCWGPRNLRPDAKSVASELKKIFNIDNKSLLVSPPITPYRNNLSPLSS